MARSSRSRAVSVVLTVVAFVMTHQLVFLYTYGPSANAALARTGHGLGWSSTVAVVLGAGATLAMIAIIELVRLSRRARAFASVHGGSPNRADEPWRVLANRTLRDAASIGCAVAVMLLFSENVEHALIAAPLPGLAVLSGPEYSGTLPILTMIASAIALVRALCQWRREVLTARIQAARPKLPRATAVTVRVPDVRSHRPRTSIGLRIAGRSPPFVTPS